MRECRSASVLVVNAEVDSMGGVVEGGVGVGTKASPRRAAIEKVQAELRQEYDVREERRRELEFLEKGGNPLDFKFGNAASVSVQSTSPTDHHPELFVTSEAKGSFAFTASPHGDSVESSGRPGARSVCEPNSADNLMLFDAENDSLEGDRSSAHLCRSNIVLTEHSFQLDGSRNTKELGDSAAFGLPSKSYNRRRYRSRPSRDGARSSLTDVVLVRGSHGSSLASRHGPRDTKGLLSDADNQKDQKISSNSDSKPTSPNGVALCKTIPSDNQLDVEIDDVKAVESTNDLIKDDASDVFADVNALKTLHDDQHKESVFDACKIATDKGFEESESCKGHEEVVSVGRECQPSVPTPEVENLASSGQMNGFSTAKGNEKSKPNDGHKNTTVLVTKVLDSESSCTQTSHSLDGNNDSEMWTNVRNSGSNGNVKEQTSMLEVKPSVEGDQMINEKNEIRTDGSCSFVNDECNSVLRSHKDNEFVPMEELNGNVSDLPNEVKNPNQNEAIDQIIPESRRADGCEVTETEGKINSPLGDNSKSRDESIVTVCPKASSDTAVVKLPETAPLPGLPSVAPEEQTSSDINFKASKAYEDSVLEEARVIETKRERIAELSMATLRMDFHRKSHWDYVLEEMAWLANDFAQERLWKITAAAQICHRVASASLLRFHEQNNSWESKKVACILARAVMEFWNSLEETPKEQELQSPRKDSSLALREYAVRFLKNNSSDVLHNHAEAPTTPDRISDLGIVDFSLDDHLTEENMFYIVPPGAIGKYRNSIESHVVKYEKTGSNIQEEVETSACDVAEFGSQENVYEEEEGETSTYDTSVAFEGHQSSRFAQKKWKISTKAYSARSFEVVADSPFMHVENKVASQQPVLTGKRPASSLNVSFPTKRVRTSNRQRLLSPFSAGTSACVQMPTKTDTSSGDTNSFQDDQSTLHGGSHMPNNLEVESAEDFEKQLPFDSAEISIKTKKKKKVKHLGSAYEQRWQQVDSNFQNEQRDLSKKRLENYQVDSNGTTGLFGQHIAKKPKMMRQSLDNSFDSSTPVGGSVPSPVASQISNQNKFIKCIGGRDRVRKNKALKMPACQQGSGSPWSLFEEQALVVLVHDLGPNWELVSDAVNSTLQFKCIFRNPKECKERHKLLMDRNTGDGADSAEDSGSSQPYNSTLPGIPKGSARQLFQRLQGPMEEDTLKSHFEKIIRIGQKLHSRRKQNNSQDPKQFPQTHGSHMLALTQVCPNNLNGGPVLTPLDLCDATASSPDMLPLGYPGMHNGGLAISNQGTMAPMLTASGSNSVVPGSSSMIVGNNFSSPSGPINGPVRDGRYAIPRSASLSIDEQQRMQQYNQMMSGRSIPQSNLSSPGALPGNDRGVRVPPGSTGIGFTGGINRSLPIARPGFQGIASSSVLNSGSMISSGMVAMPSPVNVHTGVGSSQGNSLRPRDALHMMRPNQNQDPQRQMMVSDLQMPASQGNSQGVSPFGALSSSFPNQTASSPVSSHPLHHQQSQAMSPQQPHVISPHHSHLQGANHATSQQHQAYAIRLAKERQLQHRFLQQQQQQQQQFASTNSTIPHVQPQAPLSVSSPPQNSSQIKSQATTPPVSLSPLTSASPMAGIPQHQPKHPILPHGLSRNAQTVSGGLTNPMSKQRVRQPQQQQQQQFQQAGRQHPQQRQQTQSQQQAKLTKGVGRGNMMMHQNIPIDPSLLNGLSSNPVNQTLEKGEQTMHLVQGQGLYPGSATSPAQSGNPLLSHSSNQSQPHQKMYPGQPLQISKHLQPMPSHSDTVIQGRSSSVPSNPSLSSGHKSVPPLVMASSSNQQPQLQPHQKLANQNQPTIQRVLQQNCHVNDPSAKLQGRESQTEQSPLTNLSQLGTTSLICQPSNDATNVPQAISSSGSQWRGSESSYDSGALSPAANMNSVGTPSTNPAGNEPSSQVGHCLGQRQSSGNLPPVGHDVGTPWQQQPSSLQQPSSPVSQQQQLQQQPSQQQLPPTSLSQQQTHLVGNSSLYVRPTDSRLE